MLSSESSYDSTSSIFEVTLDPDPVEMADRDLKKAKAQRTNVETILLNSAKKLKKLMEKEELDRDALRVQLDKYQAAWDKFDSAHADYVAVKEGVEDEDAEYFMAKFETFDDLCDEANSKIKKASGGNSKEQLDDLKSKQNSELELMSGSLNQVDKTIKEWESEGSSNLTSIEVQKQLLNEAVARMEIVEKMKCSIVMLDPSLSQEQRELVSKHSAESTVLAAGLRNRLGVLEDPLVNPRDNGGSHPHVRSSAQTSSVSSTGAHVYAKRSFPSFSGQRRDYPGFRKEWHSTVALCFEEPFLLREILKCVPKSIVPEIKNLKRMSEVFDILDEEYADIPETVYDLTQSLTEFKFSKEAKTDSKKFGEFYAKWREVYVDLEELDKVSALDHEPTLMTLVGKLPGEASRQRYVEAKIKGKSEDKKQLEVMVGFMEAEKLRQKQMGRVQEMYEKSCDYSTTKKDTEPVKKKDGSCFSCGATDHQIAACPKRKSAGSRSVNANLREPPAKPCPACNQQHSAVTKDGVKIFKTRLSVCDTFKGLAVDARSELIQNVQGCSLCLDWSGDHKRDSCSAKFKGQPFQKCPVDVNGNKCGANHHTLLHGTTSFYSNYLCVNALSSTFEPPSPAGCGPPTEEDMEVESKKARAFLQIQSVKFKGGVNTGVVFFDGGSNINLVRRDFAKMLGVLGRSTVQILQTTGQNGKPWHTTVYWLTLIDKEGGEHRVLAFEMEFITGLQNNQDVSRIQEIFPQVTAEQVRRSIGTVDLLMGIHYAQLHPTVKKENVVGNLRLLESKFGSGWLLDGYHPLLQKPSPVMIHRDCQMVRASTLGRTINSEAVRLTHFTRKTPAIKSKQIFSFTECEEMGVGMPKRCGKCLNCNRCSVRSQEMSRREEKELAMIEESVSLDVEKKELSMYYPLLKDGKVLGDNKQQAIGVARGLEHSLIKKKQLDEYNSAFDDFIERGVIREISQEELDSWEGDCNYISHHGVIKPGSITTKLRVVSNSSLDNNGSGVSLNSILPKGPNSLSSLFESLTSWRGNKHVVCWDIAKAYHTIKTGKQEMHFRRLVWRYGDLERNFKIYGFLVLTFGDKPAACALEVGKELVADQAHLVLKEAAQGGEDPAICDERMELQHNTVEDIQKMIRREYVDDGNGGGSSAAVTELIGEEEDPDGNIVYNGAIAKVLGLGGFGVKVMVRDGESRSNIIDKLGGVLGLDWDPKSDQIKMRMKVNITQKKSKLRVGPELTKETLGELRETKMTRRLVVSQIYGVYDPLGLLTPATIKLKLLLQQLSLEAGGDGSEEAWDAELNEELSTASRMALRTMVEAGEFYFPRTWNPEGTFEEWELLAWGDGGKPASCGVCYSSFRLKEPGKSGQSRLNSLMAAKARVKPSKADQAKEAVSIPRMEMTGAVLVHRLITAVLPGCPTKPKRIRTFADSECIISCLSNDQRKLGMWFGNRAAEIAEHRADWRKQGIEVDLIYHWPGDQNPADLGTKGKASVEDFRPGGMWLSGPEAASYDEETWPVSRDFVKKVPPEAEHGARSCLATQALGGFEMFQTVREIIMKHNNLDLIRGVLARTLAAWASRNRDMILQDPTVLHLQQAESLLFLSVAEEVGDAVRAGKLQGLCPKWLSGRWVTRGRLGKGMFKVLGVTELPILLTESKLGRLFMVSAHYEDHSGPKSTLWRSRARVWIVRGAKIALNIERNCIICKKRKVEALKQKIGDLGEERLQVGTKPFTHVALDLTGPILTKAMGNSRAKIKVWPLVIVCQSTGAMHIAVMHNYGTKAFLTQWEQFVALRGKPSGVTSDKGSQLTSKENYVAWTDQEDPSRWGWEEIKAGDARKGIVWKFVPAGCQWRNGLAERRVAVTKRTLKMMMGSTLIHGNPTLTYPELCTLLSRVANIVNNRPVGVRNLGEEQMLPLTINQLLLGRTETAENETVGEEEENYEGADKYQEELLTVWWNMWKIQVLPSLIPYNRYKDAGRHRNLVPGDVCLMNREGKFRGSFQLCKVERVQAGDEGIVRTVVVKIKKKGDGFKCVEKEVGIQRLVLVLSLEDQNEQKK